MAVKVAIDTNIFLNVKNREEPFFGYSKRILDAVDNGKLKCVLSAVIVAELCAGYYEYGEIEEKDEFLFHVVTSPNYLIIPLNVEVADEAGKIRQLTRLGLPDAIIVASASLNRVATLITHDERLRKAKDVIRILTAEQTCKEMSLL